MAESQFVKFELQSIGVFRSDRSLNYSVPRQASHDSQDNFSSVPGQVQLFSKQNFEQALIGLEGFDHIWLVYLFHKNDHWNPMTRPPRGSDKKMGVFATRAPYRPNQIGLSCVKLVSIEGLKLNILGADLLDETPILDIKPYIAYCDSFPGAKQGWLQDIEEQKYQVEFDNIFLTQWRSLFKKAHQYFPNQSALIDQLVDFTQRQLEHDPLNREKKRVIQSADSKNYILCYRTWRILFSIDHQERKINVLNLRTGYTAAELATPEDPYGDKELHKIFHNYLSKTFT